MTNKQFCEIYSSFYVDGIDHIEQLVTVVYDGEELKDIIEFFIKQLQND